jgi:hypothetical protein
MVVLFCSRVNILRETHKLFLKGCIQIKNSSQKKRGKSNIFLERFPSGKHFPFGKRFLAGKGLPVGKWFTVGRRFLLCMLFQVGKCFPRTTMWRNSSQRHQNEETFPEGNLLEFSEIFTPAFAKIKTMSKEWDMFVLSMTQIEYRIYILNKSFKYSNPSRILSLV